jgi:bcr-type benzoyl-CoA reductase subunit C
VFMAQSEALQILVDAARVPLPEWPDRYGGFRAMGYLCSYVPEEMIHAAGFVPLRVRGTSAPLRHVDAHLQSYTCALCRSSLDQALNGELQFLAGAVFAHTCDAMQALADLWRMNHAAAYFVDTVMQPVNLGTPAARPFLIAELSRLRERLAAFSGQAITDKALKSSIGLYNETRTLVDRLQTNRERLAAREFYAILDAAQVMPRELFNPLLVRSLDELAGAPERISGPRLFLAGAVLDEPRLLDLVEDLGARVGGDDLCSGSRHFREMVDDQEEPLSALAKYFLERLPCPTKFHPDHRPGLNVVEQARESKADGVVFVIEKFCEPHAFDFAMTGPALDEAGLPFLLLEMEQMPSIEALRTRLQAFIEIL